MSLAAARVAGRVANRAARSSRPASYRVNLMASFSFARKLQLSCLLAAGLPVLAGAQGNYAAEGLEYNITGPLPGEQVYPQASIRPSGGYLVWQDNSTDGFGLGISARKLDGSLSSAYSPFRVNQNGNFDQEHPSVSMLKDGGAVFVWEGGRQSFQHIYARFLSAAGTWVTTDVQVNTPTNIFQTESAVTTLANSNVVVVWSSFGQLGTNSLRDVFAQIMTPTGAKVGGEIAVNQFITYNQRSAALAPLSDGRFVVVWVSEQERRENSVDVYGRVFNANGVPSGGEFRISTSESVCASPSIAASSDGGFAVTWMEKDVVTRSNSWDVFVRPFNSSLAGGTVRRVNTAAFGDQLGPKISSMGTDYLIIWTSMGQDGSREGIYGQFVRSDASLLYPEFRVNTTTVSQQIHPAVASDGVGQFLAVWASFAGSPNSFDLYAQRYFNTNAPLPAPGAPMVSVLSADSLSVSWPPVQGFSIASYEVYADGGVTAAAAVSDTYWTATGLQPASAHSYRLAYVLTDGRRSPLSSSTTKTTYSGGFTWGGIPQEWMGAYFGDNPLSWPSPSADNDGDGASNRDEYFAGTNPDSASSVLRQRMVQTPQGPYLTWNTEPGLVYRVQRSVNMGDWQNFTGPRFAAGYMDSLFVGGSHTGFYRIRRVW